MGIKVTDKQWMQLAYQQALVAQSKGEVPVGAVVVSEDNILLGSGYNQVIETQDPTAHAEIIALRQASAAIGNYRLENTSLYVTLEPCAMCAGALIHARVKRLIFATRDFKTGAAGSVYNLFQGNCNLSIDEGLMQADCSYLLRGFFSNLRV
jgi:tRNA(adenine34) deaminase